MTCFDLIVLRVSSFFFFLKISLPKGSRDGFIESYKLKNHKFTAYLVCYCPLENR